jgi:hypothetical protein
MAIDLSPRHVPPLHGFLPVLLLTIVGLLVSCGASTSQPARRTPSPTKQLKGTITEYPIPTADNSPFGITAGPDGNLWFTERGSNKIGRITTSGNITEFTLPTPRSGLFGITAGPDGNLWFTEASGDKIGRLM